jgi:secondary thiamine-phosphate synthase enzyme
MASLLTTAANPPPLSPPHNPHTQQYTLTLPPAKRGCHLITRHVTDAAKPGLAKLRVGLAHVFIQHTSASLTINENACPDVRADLATWFKLAIPEGPRAPWTHTDEGDDDMPAHVASTIAGCAVTVPICGGRLALGTWQGIYLNEHRDVATPRTLVITLQGDEDPRA